jgi:glycerol-3-phosphate dehydrogenase
VTHAERLGLELVLDAMEENASSLALNHVKLVGSDGAALLIQDNATGAIHRVTADIVVNAGGAWIDRVNAALGLATKYIGGNKGSHLIVDNAELHDALDGKMIYFGASDGRVGLLYPFLGRVLIGSTDIPIDDPDLAICETSERDYMLATVREVFPDIKVGPDQVVYTYCGVRPLPRADGKDPGAVSRDHSITTDRLPGTEVPVYSLIGGKWTTFRGFAEEAADLVLKRLGRSRRESTALRPIGGGKDYPRTPVERAQTLAALQQSGLSSSRAETLLERYGSRAFAVAATCAQGPDAPLISAPDFTRLEIAFLVDDECVVRLADILFRRTTLALSGRLTAAIAEEIADIAGERLGWDDARRAAELEDASDIGVRQHGMEPLSLQDLKTRPEAKRSSARGPGRATR